MAYKCSECGEIFDDPNYMEVDMEVYNGVASMFPGPHHYLTFASCPNCGSSIDTEWDVYHEYDDEEEDE